MTLLMLTLLAHYIIFIINTVCSITVLVFLTNALLSVGDRKADREMQGKDLVPL